MSDTASPDEVLAGFSRPNPGQPVTRPAGIGRRGQLRAIPPGWEFESRFDAGTWCEHERDWVVIVGNQARFVYWRCTRCLNQVVPVAPGWAWDRRHQTHVHLESERLRAKLGHPSAYMRSA